ncbi:MAG: MerR family transcriptional regulator [Clostridia bacterium]
MKNEYTIHEFAQLYGVGNDLLRYYERLGLLHPKRSENGYRIYRLQDVYRLTIIRDLRQLDFSTARIGEYLSELTVDHTLQLLQEEQQLISDKISELRLAQKSIVSRVDMLHAYADKQSTQKIEIQTLPERACLRLNTNISRDEEVDFAIKKLHSNNTDLIRDLGSQTVGAEVELQEVLAGGFDHYHSVFFLLPHQKKWQDFCLPAGEYACLLYKGSYRQGKQCAKALLQQLRELDRTPIGNLLEFYHIDNRYTGKEAEFTTEMQVLLQ